MMCWKGERDAEAPREESYCLSSKSAELEPTQREEEEEEEEEQEEESELEEAREGGRGRGLEV